MRRALLATLVVLMGCHEGREFAPQEIQTLEITLADGINLGTEAMPNADRALRFDVVARNRKGDIAVDFTGKVQSYVFFLGTLSPKREDGASSLAEIMLTNGEARGVTLNLPTAFGPSSLWLEDEGELDRPTTYAVGATPTIWYRTPFLSDVQRPPVPATARATPSNYHTSLEGKQVVVNSSQWGVDGRLVVTSVDTQAYTVSDVKCGPGGTPPCTSGPLGHMYVFTFSKPPMGIEPGTVLADVRGGVSDFVGFTELNFPRQDLAKTAEGAIINDPRLIPAPTLLTAATSTDNAVMEDNEAGLVELRNFKVCAPTSPDDLDRFVRFHQWPTDVGTGCGRGPSFATTVSSFDPLTNGGLDITRGVGVLRNVAGDSSSGSFSFWTITIRSTDDLECSKPGCKGM